MFGLTLLLLFVAVSEQFVDYRGNFLFKRRISDDLYGQFLHYDMDNSGRCFDILQKMMGCVKQNGYQLHHIPDMPQVRETWLLERLLSSPEKLEKLTKLVNQKIPAFIQSEIEVFKNHAEFKLRFLEDVKKKLHNIVAESVRSDAESMEAKFVDVTNESNRYVSTQQSLFLKEFLELTQKAKDRSFTLPPTDVSRSFEFRTSTMFTEPSLNTHPEKYSYIPFDDHPGWLN